MRRYAMVAAVAGSMVIGGVVGALVFGAVSATAQSSSSSPSAPAGTDGRWSGHWGPFGPGGWAHDADSDLSVAARTIGISESDLMTALGSGSSIADVAKQHGVDVQTVIDALVNDAEAELAAAVRAGRLTQAQADQMKSGLEERVTARVNASGGMFPHGPFGHFGPGAGASLAVAAKTIGVSESALVKALQGGSSIAQVAKQHGVAIQRVVSALVADAKSRLADAVKAGRITQEQANTIESNLTQRITEMVNHPGLGCGPGMGRPGMGFGPPDAAYGIPPSDQASA